MNKDDGGSRGMSDIAAHLGQKNETIERLLAENIRLRDQLTQATSAGEKIALRLAEYVKAASKEQEDGRDKS